VHKVVEIKSGNSVDAVAVIADHWWQAKTAIDAMSIQWDPGQWAAVDSETILANLQTGLEVPPDIVLREDGNVEATLASAAQTLEAEYFVPYFEHATMEPMNCTALITDDTFEVWAPTQMPERATG
jgi:isoquinoline 1-oxidoreductase beta subunit